MIFGVLNPEKIAINRYFSNAGIKDDGMIPSVIMDINLQSTDAKRMMTILI